MIETLKNYGPHAWWALIAGLSLNALGFLAPVFDLVLASPRLFIAVGSLIPTIVSLAPGVPPWVGTVALIGLVASIVLGLVYRHYTN